MADNQPLPALRRIDISPLRDGEDLRFVLVDPTQVSTAQLVISAPGYFILAHLDGQHTDDEVRRAFLQQFGAAVTSDQIQDLVGTLDEALMLDNERYAAALHAREQAYRDAPFRDNTERWPAADALQAELEQILQDGSAQVSGRIRGLIAPHLDYQRGAPCYADAYAALRQAPPADRYVILGTNHFGRCSATLATAKDFRTPLGEVRTDRALLQRLEQRLGQSIHAAEFDHDREHSIELQVHLLQHTQPDYPFEILPVLCPDPSGPTGSRPVLDDGPDLDAFIDALRAELAEDDRATVLIASADLSHVGQYFGETEPTTAAFLAKIEASDRSLLDLLSKGEVGAFVQTVGQAGNVTRICSVGNLYTMLSCLPTCRCDILRYHQAVSLETETHVTCAAGVVCEDV